MPVPLRARSFAPPKNGCAQDDAIEIEIGRNSKLSHYRGGSASVRQTDQALSFVMLSGFGLLRARGREGRNIPTPFCRQALGILRLRGHFALRSSHSGHDDTSTPSWLTRCISVILRRALSQLYDDPLPE
jgi:hypothetical protein